MIADAIAAIQAMANASANAPKTIDIPGKADEYGVVQPGKPLEIRVKSPPFHAETLETPEQLAEFIKATDGGPDLRGGRVYVSPDKAVFVFDHNDRRDRAACNFKYSDQFAWLKSERAFQRQAEIVRTLRIIFRGCLGDGSTLTSRLRTLKLSTAGATETDVQHGKESVSRAAMAALTGADQIPEEFPIDLPVFANFKNIQRIWCALEINVQDQTFKITPYPRELDAAMESTLESICEVFGELEIPVLRGKPE